MRYRKKPLVIEAVRWTGYNEDELAEFMGVERVFVTPTRLLLVATLEGRVHAGAGDYVVRGVRGEFYPCKPEVFEKTYEVVG